MSLVIIGGGIIGLSIAYYHALARPHRQIIIIDSESELLKSASGFSGGYLVRDWFSPPVLQLAELSFQLHKQLASANDGRQRWGYCESTAYSLVMEVDEGMGPGDGVSKKFVRGEDWLLHGTSRAEAAKAYASSAILTDTPQSKDAKPISSVLSSTSSPRWAKALTGAKFERISSESGCAQVEPRELCQWLEEQCRSMKVEFRLSTQPAGLVSNGRGRSRAIRVKTCEPGGSPYKYDIPCRDIVISAGCWTPRVFKTLVGQRMSPGIKPLPGYSCVMRSEHFSRPIFETIDGGASVEMAHATFCPPTSDWPYSPECMARYTKGGKPEIYVAGLNDETIKLPERAGHTKNLMERSKLDQLQKTAGKLVKGNLAENDIDDELELVREGLCFRPVSDTGLPIISEVTGIELEHGGRLYVASGHGPWGISLSLGTGFVVSELLQGIKHNALTEEMGLDGNLSFLKAHL